MTGLNTTKAKLSRKQVKLRQRLNLAFKWWFKYDLSVCWLTLTSAPDSIDLVSSKRGIWDSWGKMVREIKRQYGVKIEYAAIETNEGFGVLHIFLVTDKRLPKIQKFLSDQWSIYHHANRVWIEEVGRTDKDAEKISWYAVTQYASTGQGSHFKKAMWSRFSFLPNKPQHYLDMAKKALKEMCYELEWHVNYKNINPAAESFMLKGFMEYKGYKISLFGDLLDYIESPYCNN